MIAFSVFLGLIITVATSFVYNSYVFGEFPNIQFISIPILGVGYWGMPLPWLRQIVYPGAPKQIVWSHFIIDVIFWAAVVFVLKLFYFTIIKKKPKKVRARKRPRKAKKPKASRRSRR